MTDLDAATFEGVAFLGNTLAPFFLQDPRTGDAGAEFAAVAVLDAQAAGAEWPFGHDGRGPGAELRCRKERRLCRGR